MTTDEAADKLRALLARMGIEATVDAHDEPDHIALEVHGPEAGLVIGKHGATLDALQYLVNKMAFVEESVRRPVYVDAEGYRRRRAEQLGELAQRLAGKAKKSGRPVHAEPMLPADRRVMHLALADDPSVTTRSEGEGADRHLVIVPTDGAGGS